MTSKHKWYGVTIMDTLIYLGEHKSSADARADAEFSIPNYGQIRRVVGEESAKQWFAVLAETVFSDTLCTKAGAVIADDFKMRKDPDHADRHQLKTGSKTDIGVARMALRYLREALCP